MNKPASAIAAHGTTFSVLFAISFCHLLNDMMQSLIPSIYPSIKTMFHLSFAQIGLITLVFQCTASLLQPVVGLVADRRPMPFSISRQHNGEMTQERYIFKGGYNTQLPPDLFDAQAILAKIPK